MKLEIYAVDWANKIVSFEANYYDYEVEFDFYADGMLKTTAESWTRQGEVGPLEWGCGSYEEFLEVYRKLSDAIVNASPRFAHMATISLTKLEN